MDLTKPKWMFVSIKNTAQEANRHIFIFRNGHEIADGIRIVEFLQQMLTFKNGSPASLSILNTMRNNKT